MRAFVAVVYVEEKFPQHNAMDRIGPSNGSSAGSYAKRHVLPLAYCEICKTTIFVGPMPEAVEGDIEKRNTEAADKSARDSFENLGHPASDEELVRMFGGWIPGEFDPVRSPG